MATETRFDCATGKVTQIEYTPEPAPPPEDIPADEIRRRLLKLAGVSQDIDDAKMAEVFMASDVAKR